MITGLKPYPAMKDSGVLWLGDVPEHWEVVPNRSLLKLKKKLVGAASGNFTLLSLTKQGIIPRDLENPEGKFPASFDTYQEVEPGDLIFCLFDIDETPRAVGLSTLCGMITGAYSRFVCSDLETVKFIYLFYIAMDNGKHLKPLYTGLRKVITKTTFLSAKMPLPPPDERDAIVRFISYVDHRIRKCIRTKQKLIKLLEEQKQAVIHRAVTRGLDPNVRLKPSGVEWLAEVPEHWGVRRLKILISRVTSGSRGWSNFIADDGPLFIRIGNLTRASIGLNFTDAVRLNLPKAAIAEAERTRVRAGDLLLSITAFIGSVAVVPDSIGEAYISQHVACCQPIPGLANTKWLAYVLLSPIGQTHGKLCMYGGTKQGLSLDDVKNYIVLLPPDAEQDALVSWIENATKSVDEVIYSTHREITLLREYQTRLVEDAVTGKLDVREAVARLPEETNEPDPLEDADALAEGEEDTHSIDPEAVSDEVEA